MSGPVRAAMQDSAQSNKRYSPVEFPFGRFSTGHAVPSVRTTEEFVGAETIVSIQEVWDGFSKAWQAGCQSVPVPFHRS